MSIPFNGFRKIHLMPLDIQNVKETIHIKGVNAYIEGPPPDPALLYFLRWSYLGQVSLNFFLCLTLQK